MPTKAKKTNSKAPAKKTPERKEPRQLKARSYSSFRLQKKIRPSQPKLPSSFWLMRRAIGTLIRRWKLFLGIAVIYGILVLVLVRGLGGTPGLQEMKQLLEEEFQGASGQTVTATSLFLYMLGTSGATNTADTSLYHSILVVVTSLAVIWALRQAYASKLSQTIRIRDSFYRGMSPLVPFLLVVAVLFIELIPVAVVGFLYTAVVNGGIAVLFIERFVWAFAFGLSVMLSLYLLCSTIFALYIAALPDMTPMRALRAARSLVRYRRLVVLRKILMFGIISFVAAALIMIPFLLFAVPIAEWVFFAITTIGVVVAHSYMYALYRELLNE